MGAFYVNVKTDGSFAALISCVPLSSGEADLRGEVERGEQAILRGAGELAAQPVGGGAGPLPVLPLRGHLQHDADGPGPVLGLVPGALVRAGGQQNILPAKA